MTIPPVTPTPSGSAPARSARLTAALCASALLAAALAPDLTAQSPRTFIVESPTMATGQMMSRDYAPDGRNVSPPLAWRGLPEGTRQLVVICQDHGAGNPPPWVHWIIYNIPASATGLPEGIPFDAGDPMPAGLEGAVQGNNGWGLAMYRGPAPPANNLHHYDFAVLALDAELDLPPGLTRAEVLDAIEGHVIGRGNMVPIYRRQPLNAGGGAG
ncbi:MAG: YbhB/YbcL family Raf kinase inhibitor-like protein [Gemmatimonadota bacterium]